MKQKIKEYEIGDKLIKTKSNLQNGLNKAEERSISLSTKNPTEIGLNEFFDSKLLDLFDK